MLQCMHCSGALYHQAAGFSVVTTTADLVCILCIAMVDHSIYCPIWYCALLMLSKDKLNLPCEKGKRVCMYGSEMKLKLPCGTEQKASVWISDDTHLCLLLYCCDTL
eukprot:TRINITY_DN5281_c0_g1_i1.p1 TRINITY_DN5281_c0_g1~~TRINITY_DN5281_c0_g1_i1.p1  ORF type:complete len:107 (-),score=2.72 TRINITY_DN5281_c0_g1_i1:567-887(-)